MFWMTSTGSMIVIDVLSIVTQCLPLFALVPDSCSELRDNGSMTRRHYRAFVKQHKGGDPKRAQKRGTRSDQGASNKIFAAAKRRAAKQAPSLPDCDPRKTALEGIATHAGKFLSETKTAREAALARLGSLDAGWEEFPELERAVQLAPTYLPVFRMIASAPRDRGVSLGYIGANWPPSRPQLWELLQIPLWEWLALCGHLHCYHDRERDHWWYRADLTAIAAAAPAAPSSSDMAAAEQTAASVHNDDTRESAVKKTAKSARVKYKNKETASLDKRTTELTTEIEGVAPGPAAVSRPREQKAALVKDLQWHYLDSNGDEFGPFSTRKMRRWCARNAFLVGAELRVRLSQWTSFVPLSTAYPDVGKPFVGPPEISGPGAVHSEASKRSTVLAEKVDASFDTAIAGKKKKTKVAEFYEVLNARRAAQGRSPTGPPERRQAAVAAESSSQGLPPMTPQTGGQVDLTEDEVSLFGSPPRTSPVAARGSERDQRLDRMYEEIMDDVASAPSRRRRRPKGPTNKIGGKFK